jgi:tetratricopeptide (TPR) repeat protein
MAGSALALARVGEASEALNRVEEAERAVARNTTAGMRRAWDDHLLGRAYLLLGRLDKARELAGRALQLLPLQPGAAAHALHLLGDVAIHPDRFDAESAETYYRKALALAEPRGMRPLIAQCHLGLGLLYQRTDRRPVAREHLTLAATAYREMAMVFWLEQADAAIAAVA